MPQIMKFLTEKLAQVSKVSWSSNWMYTLFLTIRQYEGVKESIKLNTEINLSKPVVFNNKFQRILIRNLLITFLIYTLLESTKKTTISY